MRTLQALLITAGLAVAAAGTATASPLDHQGTPAPAVESTPPAPRSTAAAPTWRQLWPQKSGFDWIIRAVVSIVWL